ncbi:uncharacterized protein LOC120359197 [Solenopsis invicta]|uniref:uncharacterized protein LOC120359197 n=1 Tax=Solenopsis invicta TaxID=13686 RepID=UPI00193CB043|nr:uncharacterized protein LOC120359197 [Solenopsis invicta]
MDDDAEIPESTLRRRRLLETAQKESLQAEKHANNENVWNADESLSSNSDNLSSDSTDTSKNKVTDRSSIEELTSVSSTSDTSENKESDRSSTDDRCTDQTPDIFFDESFGHADVTDPKRNEESLIIN